MKYFEAFEPKWVNSDYIEYEVNSLRLGGLHIVKEEYNWYIWKELDFIMRHKISVKKTQLIFMKLDCFFMTDLYIRVNSFYTALKHL